MGNDRCEVLATAKIIEKSDDLNGRPLCFQESACAESAKNTGLFQAISDSKIAVSERSVEEGGGNSVRALAPLVIRRLWLSWSLLQPAFNDVAAEFFFPGFQDFVVAAFGLNNLAGLGVFVTF